jgi:hypothetical protein
MRQELCDHAADMAHNTAISIKEHASSETSARRGQAALTFQCINFVAERCHNALQLPQAMRQVR